MVVNGSVIDIPDQTLLEMLSQTAAAHPDLRATIFADREMTYGQLYQAVIGLMGRLQAAGIKPGQRVGIMLPNCPQYVISYYAITGLGAIVVQINPLCAAPEFSHLVADAGVKALVVYDKLLPLVRAVRAKQPIDLLVAVRFGASDAVLSDGDVWFDEWLAGAVAPGKPEPVDPDDVAVLQYTGGTTGLPKGAMLTHRNLVANVVQTSAVYPGGLSSQDVIVCALPFFHVYAMTVCMNSAVLNGMAMLIVPRFHPTEILELIKQYKPSLFPAVPTMYVALSQVLPAGSADLQCLRVCLSGGAPMPKQVMLSFEALSGATVIEGYGLSESSPVTHFNRDKANRKVGSIGLAVPSTEVKVVSLDDGVTELGTDEVGELAIRGPQVMKGYWNQPEETRHALVDGWLMTGDIAQIDADGYAYIVDRKKDLIIASGFNVYPREVEEALYKHPSILEAAVIGVQDDYRGETVKAFIVLKDGAALTTSEVEEWCRQQLSAYKVPKLIEFRAELPKTSVGKVLRRALRTPSAS